MRGIDSADEEVTVSGVSIFSVSDKGRITETWLRFEANLDESQSVVPKDEFREWLLEDATTVERAANFRLGSINDEFLRWCCFLLKPCCHEPPPPDTP